MKILVTSDSHGDKYALLDAAKQESPDCMLHLGDFDSDCSLVISNCPDTALRAVRGNCDRFSRELDVDEFTLGGKRFVMTHGHLYSVKTGYAKVIEHADRQGADVLLFGHTHTPYYELVGGMLVANPGSIGYPPDKSYAVINIDNGSISCEIKFMP